METSKSTSTAPAIEAKDVNRVRSDTTSRPD
jgi:hypothetical protein